MQNPVWIKNSIEGIQISKKTGIGPTFEINIVVGSWVKAIITGEIAKLNTVLTGAHWSIINGGIK